MNIQFEEEQENLKLDSDKLKIEKSCLNCEIERCYLEDYAKSLGGIFIPSNWHCSLWSIKEVD